MEPMERTGPPNQSGTDGTPGGVPQTEPIRPTTGANWLLPASSVHKLSVWQRVTTQHGTRGTCGTAPGDVGDGLPPELEVRKALVPRLAHDLPSRNPETKASAGLHMGCVPRILGASQKNGGTSRR